MKIIKAKYQKEVSVELLDVIYLLKILEELFDGDGKITTLLKVLINKTQSAFKKNEDYIVLSY